MCRRVGKSIGALLVTGSVPSSASVAVAEASQAATAVSVRGTELAHSGAVTASGAGAVTTGTLLPAISMITLACAEPVLLQRPWR